MIGDRTAGVVEHQPGVRPIGPNRDEIDAICGYSVRQHLAAARVQPEALFHPSVLET